MRIGNRTFRSTVGIPLRLLRRRGTRCHAQDSPHAAIATKEKVIEIIARYVRGSAGFRDQHVKLFADADLLRPAPFRTGVVAELGRSGAIRGLLPGVALKRKHLAAATF